MRKHSTILASALAAGAAALLISTPIASADDPPPCAADDQQCLDQQEQQGAGIANQVIDNVQQGVDQAKQANEALNPQNSTEGLGIMVNLNGVPYCMPLNKPLPPGAVVTSPTGNGVSSWC